VNGPRSVERNVRCARERGRDTGCFYITVEDGASEGKCAKSGWYRRKRFFLVKTGPFGSVRVCVCREGARAQGWIKNLRAGDSPVMQENRARGRSRGINGYGGETCGVWTVRVRAGCVRSVVVERGKISHRRQTSVGRTGWIRGAWRRTRLAAEGGQGARGWRDTNYPRAVWCRGVAEDGAGPSVVSSRS
jgi:hypothetical protein